MEHKVRFASAGAHKQVLGLARLSPHTRDFGNALYFPVPRIYQDKRVLVVRSGRKVIGFLLLRHRIRRPQYTSVNFVAVHPDWRGKGVGRALTQHALSLSPTGTLLASVDKENTEAQEAYRAWGWTHISDGVWKSGKEYGVWEIKQDED